MQFLITPDECWNQLIKGLNEQIDVGATNYQFLAYLDFIYKVNCLPPPFNDHDS